MRSLIAISCALLLRVVGTISLGHIQSSARADDRGSQTYYSSLAQYYRVSERQVLELRDRKISDEEMPVVFFVARKAHVEPMEVVQLRNDGQSWMDITTHYGLNPDVCYVPATKITGSPYDHAYSDFRKKPRREWKTIKLSDDDVVNLVNLRFVTDRYHTSTPVVMKMRNDGKSFVEINDQFKVGKNPRWKNNGEKGRKHNSKNYDKDK